MCETISNRLEAENDHYKNQSGKKQKLDSWKKDESKMTPEALETIRKIKAGQI